MAVANRGTSTLGSVLPCAPRPAGRFETVLLATDLSTVSEGATTEAVELCRALRARLLIVNVIDAPKAHVLRLDQVRAERERRLLSAVDGARALGVSTDFLVWIGEPGPSIVAAAEAEGANLVVVGTRALDRAGRFLLGSVSDYVVNNSPCPVVIAR